MKKKIETPEVYRSVLISQLLTESTPLQKAKVKANMELAARLDDLITRKGWNKKQFAEQLKKSPSEITKWLSGTHNFTIETLTEITLVLDCALSDLFAPKKVQSLNNITIVVSSKEAATPIPYRTPVTGSGSPWLNYQAQSLHEASLPLTLRDN